MPPTTPQVPPRLVSPRPAPVLTPEQLETVKRSQSDPDRPAKLPEKLDLSNLPWAVDLRQQEFLSEPTRRQLLALDQAVRDKAKADKLSAQDKYLYHDDSGTPGFKNYYRTYRMIWDFGSQPVHTIRIDFWLREDNPMVQSYSLEATWRPNDGWGVNWQYHPHLANDDVAFGLVFHHPTLAPYGTPGLPLAPSSQQFVVEADGQWAKHPILTIRSHNPKLLNQTHAIVLDERRKRLPRYWDSAESFRDVALEELQFLTTAAARWEADGAMMQYWGGGTSGGDPPHIAGFRSASLDERKKILADVELQNAKRRALVDEYYVEMHRALLNSLPAMREMLLEELQPPQPDQYEIFPASASSSLSPPPDTAGDRSSSHHPENPPRGQ